MSRWIWARSGLALWWEGIQDAEGAAIEAAGHLPSLERPEATARLVRTSMER